MTFLKVTPRMPVADLKNKVEWGPEVYAYGRREFAVRDPTGAMLIFSEETDDPATCEGV